MTKTATSFASKLAVALVAVAMVFTAFASTTQAQTTEDLQQMINDLLAQVAQLQGQVTGGTTAGAECSPFLMDLGQGTKGADVVRLQEFLNQDADTRVAAAGQAGSAGMETSFYGPATAAAVSKFQVKYRAEILSPGGLVNPTGYFGPSSRTKANAICATVVTPDDGDVDEDEDEDEDEEDDFELRGSADLYRTYVDDASDTTIEEGDADVAIGEVSYEFRNGDAEINRMTIGLKQVSGTPGEERAWDVFESVSLWVDGDKIAEVDADSRRDYLDEDDKTLRFSDLGVIGEEDEEVVITVAATIRGAIRNLVNQDDWDLSVTDVRYFDADGIAQTENKPTSDKARFSIERAGANEELRFRVSSNNPDASNIIVDTTSRTNKVNILGYEIEARSNDIDLRTLFIDIETSEENAKVVSDVNLIVDGRSYRDVDMVAVSTTSAPYVTRYEFDIKGDVTVRKDKSVDVEVEVDFKAQGTATYPNNTTVMASASTTMTKAEGADYLQTGDMKGAAVGEEHTLVAEGVAVNVGNTSAKAEQNDTTPGASKGNYSIEVELTAVEETMYVPLTSNRGTSSSVGIAYQIEDSNGAATTTGGSADSVVTRVSGGTMDGSFVKILAGQTATIKLNVSYDPAVAGFYRVQGLTVGYNTSANSPSDTTPLIPVSDFETDPVNINN